MMISVIEFYDFRGCNHLSLSSEWIHETQVSSGSRHALAKPFQLDYSNADATVHSNEL